MSNLLKRAIVASLTEHPDAEAYRQAAFLENPDLLVGSLAQGQTLTKEDFLAADEKGRPFLDTPGAWKNFEKIARIIQLGGQEFTYDDFFTQITPGLKRTLLNSAIDNNSTMKIFTAAIWKGHFAEMEKLWYALPGNERLKSPEGLVPVALKRELLAAEGREAPEDRLAKAQLSLTDIRNALVYDSNFNDVTRRLKAAGDYFRKDYVMLPDSDGDTIFARRPSFTKFDAILKTMQEHGERFEVSDYLKQLSTRPSLLARAAEHSALGKVFAPAQWVDRLPDMLNLWSNVLDAWKSAMSQQQFDNNYAEAENQTYAKVLEGKTLDGKADFLTPLNAGSSEKPVLPLGLKVLWENIDAIRGHLEKRGESLTTADLRLASGQIGDSCLISAVKFGRFDKVLEIAKQSNQPLTLADYLTPDGHGSKLIDILADNKLLSQVFTVDAWVGNIKDMRALWAVVSPMYRKQIDYPKLETGVQQATLKQKANGRKIQPQ
jgi:hypothetical protein